MMKKAQYLLAILVSFSLGWLGHSLHTSPAQQPQSSPVISRSEASPATAVEPRNPVVPVQRLPRGEPSPAQMGPQQTPPSGEIKTALEIFTDLLHQYRFEQAANLYAEHQPGLNLGQQQKWRSVLLDFLFERLNNGETERFAELTETWLHYQYNDIDVLLLQAKYQRVMGYYSDALQTYMAAKSYADYANQQNKVHTELQSFIYNRDSSWAGQDKWYELLTFYGQLEQLGILNRAQKYRYAELLLMHSDEKGADIILDELAQLGGWKARVRQLRANYRKEGGYHAGASSAPGFDSAIALAAQGSHHLLNVKINNNYQPTLLLDTGASITMLTADAFEKAAGSGGWQDLGLKQFNTANGLAVGRLMLAERLEMGEYTLTNVQIAVHEVEMGDKVEGLLGMNVLSQFHFQIDQDNQRLLLTPRE